MKRLLLLVVGLLAVAACTPPVDWERDFTPVAVPGTGWTMEPCEGDGPFVCVTDDEGDHLGVVEHLSFPTQEIEDLRDLKAHIRDFYETITADRLEGCEPGYRIRPRVIFNRAVAGGRGLSYGFDGIDAEGRVVERTYGVMALRGGTVHVVSAGAYDDGACLSNEGEFSVAGLKRFEPVLRALAAVTPLR